VKKAVERIGGSVGVISAPGKGAEFWIKLLAAENAPVWDAVHTPGGVTVAS
jgi:signal transduction histidine kinase